MKLERKKSHVLLHLHEFPSQTLTFDCHVLLLISPQMQAGQVLSSASGIKEVRRDFPAFQRGRWSEWACSASSPVFLPVFNFLENIIYFPILKLFPSPCNLKQP